MHFLNDDLYHTIEIGKGYHMVSYEVANGPLLCNLSEPQHSNKQTSKMANVL